MYRKQFISIIYGNKPHKADGKGYSWINQSPTAVPIVRPIKKKIPMSKTVIDSEGCIFAYFFKDGSPVFTYIGRALEEEICPKKIE